MSTPPEDGRMTTVNFLSPSISRDLLVRASASTGQSVLNVARSSGINLPFVCGEGDCGHCAVKAVPVGKTGPMMVNMPGFWERQVLLMAGKITSSEADNELWNWRTPHWRLACQCQLVEAEEILVAF